MLKPVNENLDQVTIEDIENHKRLTDAEMLNDVSNLLMFDGSENRNNFYGNPLLYHFQLKNLLMCHRENGNTIYHLWEDSAQWQKLLDDTRKRNRGGRTPAGNIFECFRINTGSVVMFKSTTAKYIYQKYGATKVLDPTAGWGGRMLGAWALGIDYVGIDTNIEMIPAYEEMTNYIESIPMLTEAPKLGMIWKSALDVDFSQLDYDFVLTSPPYINMEVYEHMTEWDSNQNFYCDFFIPLWKKCVDNIQKGGRVCFNVSPKMYEEALSFGLPACDDEEDLKQQMGQQTGKKKQDKIYMWEC